MALLVVEVSDTTLDFDRSKKASLYAQAGIPEFWIVDLSERKLEVYREPATDATQPSGHGYASVKVLGSRESMAPLAVPQAQVSVADLLPKKRVRE